MEEPGEATVPKSTSDLLLPLNSPSFHHLPLCSRDFILYPQALTDTPRRTWQVPAFLSPIKLLTYNINCHDHYSRYHSTLSRTPHFIATLLQGFSVAKRRREQRKNPFTAVILKYSVRSHYSFTIASSTPFSYLWHIIK